MGFPGGSDGKESACNVGDLGSNPGLGRFPQRRKWQPTPVFLPGEFHVQRSLAGYSPWGLKESDMTEKLTLWVSQVALVIKNPFPNAGDIRDRGLIPGLGSSPEGGNGNTLQYSGGTGVGTHSSGYPESHGQRSVVGYSPWGHRVGHD